MTVVAASAVFVVVAATPVVVLLLLDGTPVTFTLENNFALGSFAHSYLDVILFSPGLIVVYFDVSAKFHFE